VMIDAELGRKYHGSNDREGAGTTWCQNWPRTRLNFWWKPKKIKILWSITLFSFSGILPCAILIPGLHFIPESPRWLVCIILFYTDSIFVPTLLPIFWSHLFLYFYFVILNLGWNGIYGKVWIFITIFTRTQCWYSYRITRNKGTIFYFA
jgi:hypothetical protein